MTSIILTVERGDDDNWRELYVEVTGTVTRYRPATRLDSEEGGEVEDIEAYCASEAVELTQAEFERAEGMLEMQAADDAAEARYARAEWEHDARREGF